MSKKVSEKIFDSNFLRKLENIALNMKMPISQGASGARKSRAKGSSVEFSDYREYSIGDDFRKIDWNAYGRFDKFFIKLFMEEKEAQVNVFIDTSKSMDYGEIRKGEISLKIAGIISFLALNNLDRVCINEMRNDKLNYSTLFMGNNMFPECIDFMEKLEFKGKTDINKCIKNKRFSSSGLCIIISDFFMEEGIEEALKYLAYKKQEIILINVLSEEEICPNIQGQIGLIDSETKEKRNVSVTSSILKNYENQLNKFTSNLNEMCKKYGGQYIFVSSLDSIEKIVFEKLSKSGIIYGKS